MDMSMMVEQQGETLNTVEANAEQTQTKVKEGNQFIAKAIQTAKSTRTVRIIIIKKRIYTRTKRNPIEKMVLFLLMYWYLRDDCNSRLVVCL